jgi:protein TonB
MSLVIPLLAVLLPAAPAGPAAGVTATSPSRPAAVERDAEPARGEAELRAALGGEGDSAARAELAALLLRQGRDTEVREVLPPADGPEGLAVARSLLCRAAGLVDDQEINARLLAVLPAAALRVSQGITRPEILTRVSPQYTAEAREEKISGVVVLSAVIDETGTITALEVVQGLPMGLDTAALEAVRQWTFRPATLDGAPVAVCYSLTVSFQVQ